MAEAPRRVVITSARRSATRPRRQVVTQEIDDQTAVGDAYMRSLIRAQLRLAVTVLVVLAVTLGSVPLLFFAMPDSRTAQIFGMPLPWVLLGALVYPALIALGGFYVQPATSSSSCWWLRRCVVVTPTLSRTSRRPVWSRAPYEP